MGIRRGALYYFRKSGNRVRTVEPTTYGGRSSWVVVRTDGSSVGKQMIVFGRALVKKLD